MNDSDVSERDSFEIRTPFHSLFLVHLKPLFSGIFYMGSYNRMTAYTRFQNVEEMRLRAFQPNSLERQKKDLYKEPLDQLLKYPPPEHRTGATQLSIPVFYVL